MKWLIRFKKKKENRKKNKKNFKIKMEWMEETLFDSYYQTLFQFFLHQEFPSVHRSYKDEYHILIIHSCSFQPLKQFSHYLKRFHIHIYLLNEYPQFYPKIKKDIEGEEMESNIHFLEGNPFELSSITSVHFDSILLFHSSIFERNLPDLLQILHPYVLSKLYIYQSISNENHKQLVYKNYLRNKIKHMTFLPYGNLKNHIDFIQELQSCSSYFQLVKYENCYEKYIPLFGKYYIYSYILSSSS